MEKKSTRDVGGTRGVGSGSASAGASGGASAVASSGNVVGGGNGVGKGSKGGKSVDMFLTRGLERILKLTSRIRHGDLREECEAALGVL
jgi:hypothetical protein